MSPIGQSSTGAGAAPGSSAGSPATATADAAQVTKNMFMQLLVAQLKNQDPMSPADGTQFVAQLAQFQQLEQGVNTGQDVADIRAQLDTLAASLTATA